MISPNEGIVGRACRDARKDLIKTIRAWLNSDDAKQSFISFGPLGLKNALEYKLIELEETDLRSLYALIQLSGYKEEDNVGMDKK